MKYVACVLAIGAWLLACPLLGQGLPPFQVDLFKQGDQGVNTYRIPSLLQSIKGTVLAVADARRDSSRDLPGHITLVIRRSFDEGSHWTPIMTMLEMPDGGVGDASLLLDRSNGRIWCFHAYGPTGIGFSTAKPGAVTGRNTLQIHAIYSDDDGETWSKPVDLTPVVKDPSWQAVFATSGTDIQTSSGRFLVPIVVRDAAGVVHSGNIYSDDHGKTWKRGALIGDQTDESHNVQLSGGTVLQNMRNGPTRAISRSKDNGATFGPVSHDPVLIDARCNAGIIRYRNGKTDVLVFTNAASDARKNLTVKMSYDGGLTWSKGRVLNAGPSSYSTVIQLRNGELGVLYERGASYPAEKITFARFPLSWVGQEP